MIRHDVVVLDELVMTDCAYSVLFPDLPLQEFAHFRQAIDVPGIPLGDVGPRFFERRAAG
jgi:hypothetical protein